jgi:hypothetical protein
MLLKDKSLEKSVNTVYKYYESTFRHYDKVSEKINVNDETFIMNQFQKFRSMVTWLHYLDL